MNSLDTMEQALEYLENLVSGIEQAFKVQKSEPNAVINENQLIEEIKDIKDGQNTINGNIIKLYDTYDEMKRRMYPSSEGKPDKEEEIENRLETMENNISGIYQQLDELPGKLIASIMDVIRQQNEEKEANKKNSLSAMPDNNRCASRSVSQSVEEANANLGKAFSNRGVPSVTLPRNNGNHQ